MSVSPYTTPTPADPNALPSGEFAELYTTPDGRERDVSYVRSIEHENGTEASPLEKGADLDRAALTPPDELTVAKRGEGSAAKGADLPHLSTPSGVVGRRSERRPRDERPLRGLIILAARRLLKITQAEMADRLGVRQQVYARWETGERRMPPPRFYQLLNLMKADGVLSEHVELLRLSIVDPADAPWPSDDEPVTATEHGTGRGVSATPEAGRRDETANVSFVRSLEHADAGARGTNDTARVVPPAFRPPAEWATPPVFTPPLRSQPRRRPHSLIAADRAEAW